MLPEQQPFIEELYRRLFPNMFRYAKLHLENPLLAEELVQDSFHEAVRKVDVLIHHPNPQGWLMLTLQNKIQNCKRDLARQKEQILALDKDTLESILISDSAEKTMLEKDDYSQTVMRIDGALNDEEKYLLRRFTFEEASHCEIAEELGISIWASQKRIVRIRSKLEKIFPMYGKKK